MGYIMERVVSAIRSLASTTSRTKKETILAREWDEGNRSLFEIFKLAYDPMITFGVKKVPSSNKVPALIEPGGFALLDFISLAMALAARDLTGNDAKAVLNKWATNCDPEVWDVVYAPCLKKDMRCGVTATTLNAVLKSIGDEASDYVVHASDDVDCIGVQLAKPGNDDKLSGVRLVDPKLDGARLITIVNPSKRTVKQYTRGGHLNTNFPHITKAFEPLFDILTETWCFDGEIMSSEGFSTLMTMLNRQSSHASKDVYYMLFDGFPHAEYLTGTVNIPQIVRHEMLVDTCNNLPPCNIHVIYKRSIDFDAPDGKKAFAKFNADCITLGYEGVMVKDPAAPYVVKRSSSWLKFKPFIEVTLRATGFVPGSGKNASTFGSITFEGCDVDPSDETEKNIVVDVSGFTDKQRKEIWAKRDKIIGRLGEIRADAFTQERSQLGTNNWSLRFPRFKGWRDTASRPGVKV